MAPPHSEHKQHFAHRKVIQSIKQDMEIEPAHHSKKGFVSEGVSLLTNSLAHAVGGPWQAMAIVIYGGAAVAIYATYKFLT